MNESNFAGLQGYRLHRLEPGHIEEFVALGLPTCAFMHGRPPDRPELMLKNFAAFVKEYAFTKDSEVFAVSDPNKTHCAQIWLNYTRNRFNGLQELWIWDLTVRENERGKGLGKALLNMATEIARMRGIAELWLLVSSKNAKAIGLYHDLGMRAAGHLMSVQIGAAQRHGDSEQILKTAGLRALRPDDIPALYALWEQAGLPFKPHGRDSTARLSKQLAQTEIGGWCIERDDQMVACCITSSDGRKGWIERLATLPDYRGAGLGRALTAHAKQYLLDQGNLVIGALIADDNPASRAVFEAEGFVIDNEFHYFSFRNSSEA